MKARFSILSSLLRHHHRHFFGSNPKNLINHLKKQHNKFDLRVHNNSRTQIHTQPNNQISQIQTEPIKNHKIDQENDEDIWLTMKNEARSDLDHEPILSNFYFTSILSHHTIESALSRHLSMKLSNTSLPSATLHDLFMGVLTDDQEIMEAVKDDLRAVKERDPACVSYVHCFLHFKGFLACQAHRIAHKLWSQNRKILALLIQNRVSEVLALDIHLGAKIGRRILLDHATGVVFGETAVIGDNVSILHNVTLGGTGKVGADGIKVGNWDWMPSLSDVS